jgi:phenylalanyl-tRNA synthetase alpha chain
MSLPSVLSVSSVPAVRSDGSCRPQLQPLPPDALRAATSLRDLADPAAGPHAVQCVVDRLEEKIAGRWGIPVIRDPGPRTVTVTDNYDRLRYSPDAATRDRRYTRYVGDGRMLRSHMTARLPALLRRLAASQGPVDVLLSAPGLCYRRDVIDRHHVGEPHQIDLWRIRTGGEPLKVLDLMEMVDLAVAAVLPRHRWTAQSAVHPYTLSGRQIDVIPVGGASATAPLEIGECGLAHPQVLDDAGLPPGSTGLAMGLGLDRLAMLAKGVDDIRLLRSADPRIAAQMADLEPYRPVSRMPSIRRDLSVAVPADLDAELLGDRVREILGEDAHLVEEVAVLSQTAYTDLPQAARRRIGMQPWHKNVLLRIVVGDPARTLASTEANVVRDRVYAALHEGSAHQWAVT